MQNGSVETAVRLYTESLYRLAYSYAGNRADAEDVVQDTLIAMVEKAPLFFSEEHRKAWLIRVAINRCKNLLRKRATHRETELTPEIPAEVAEEGDALVTTVAALDPKYSTVLHLHYYEGYSVREIAKLLGRNESTVKTWLLRGRTALKRALEEEA